MSRLYGGQVLPSMLRYKILQLLGMWWVTAGNPFWESLAEKDYLIKSLEKQWHPTPVLLPGKSHGRRRLVGCSPWGHWGSDTTEQLHFHFSLSCIGEGNGNPLQCSCLENPRDGGAWWAAIYGVAQSHTRLKRLSSSSSNQVLSGKHPHLRQVLKSLPLEPTGDHSPGPSQLQTAPKEIRWGLYCHRVVVLPLLWTSPAAFPLLCLVLRSWFPNQLPSC